MDLESFSIGQRIKVRDNIWRVKGKFKKYHFPWILNDSLLLESIEDGITTIHINVTEDTDYKLI